MIKHTPGPYRSRGDAIVTDTPEGLDRYISPQVQQDYSSCLIAQGVAPCNQALLAAAPELLEACKTALDALGCDRVREDRLVAQRIIHLAVKKAEGQCFSGSEIEVKE